MKDFIFAALPWVLTGLTVALVFAFHDKREETCQMQGMLLGMAAGCLLSALGVPAEAAGVVLLRPLSGSAALAAVRGVMTAGLGISLGMLVGQGIGLLIPGKSKDGGAP